MAQSIMSTRWKGKASCDEVYAMLGLNPKAHLPVEGVPAQTIQGMEVWVEPQAPQGNRRKRSTHRVMVECPGCRRHVSAGRMHQHKCKQQF